MSAGATWVDTFGVRHGLSHVNFERLAARTCCGRYTDFRPGEAEDDLPVSCVACLTAPQVVGPAANYAAQWSVDERRVDVINRCRDAGKHLAHTRRDGSCLACGYGAPGRRA